MTPVCMFAAVTASFILCPSGGVRRSCITSPTTPVGGVRRPPVLMEASAAEDEVAPMKVVNLQCPSVLNAHALSDALMEAGALYVSVSDGNEGTAREQPIFAKHSPGTEGEPAQLETWDVFLEAKQLWSNSTLEVGFAPSADVGRAMLSVITAAGLSDDSALSYSVDDLAPRDWVQHVQSTWPPIVLPECVVIQFPWHTAEDISASLLAASVEASALPVVTLHPGMAFGTGVHMHTYVHAWHTCIRSTLG